MGSHLPLSNYRHPDGIHYLSNPRAVPTGNATQHRQSHLGQKFSGEQVNGYQPIAYHNQFWAPLSDSQSSSLEGNGVAELQRRILKAEAGLREKEEVCLRLIQQYELKIKYMEEGNGSEDVLPELRKRKEEVEEVWRSIQQILQDENCLSELKMKFAHGMEEQFSHGMEEQHGRVYSTNKSEKMLCEDREKSPVDLHKPTETTQNALKRWREVTSGETTENALKRWKMLCEDGEKSPTDNPTETNALKRWREIIYGETTENASKRLRGVLYGPTNEPV